MLSIIGHGVRSPDDILTFFLQDLVLIQFLCLSQSIHVQMFCFEKELPVPPLPDAILTEHCQCFEQFIEKSNFLLGEHFFSLWVNSVVWFICIICKNK